MVLNGVPSYKQSSEESGGLFQFSYNPDVGLHVLHGGHIESVLQGVKRAVVPDSVVLFLSAGALSDWHFHLN